MQPSNNESMQPKLNRSIRDRPSAQSQLQLTITPNHKPQPAMIWNPKPRQKKSKLKDLIINITNQGTTDQNIQKEKKNKENTKNMQLLFEIGFFRGF